MAEVEEGKQPCLGWSEGLEEVLLLWWYTKAVEIREAQVSRALELACEARRVSLADGDSSSRERETGSASAVRRERKRLAPPASSQHLHP